MKQSAPRNILIVEDDPRLGAMLKVYFESQGFQVLLETQGDHAVKQITTIKPDLVLLDLMLPVLDGVEVCQRVRSTYRGPILMLTACRSDIDQVAGLEAGADDYVVKPCKPRVLLARVRALLRRAERESKGQQAPAVKVTLGQLIIDSVRREVLVGTEQVGLTSTEFDVFWTLTLDRGQAVSRDALCHVIHGGGWDGIDRGIDIHVSRIRAKLRNAGMRCDVIKAVRGRGYQLTLSDQGEGSE